MKKKKKKQEKQKTQKNTQKTKEKKKQQLSPPPQLCSPGAFFATSQAQSSARAPSRIETKALLAGGPPLVETGLEIFILDEWVFFG